MSQRAVLLTLPKSKPMDIEFTNITYTVSDTVGKGKKQVLKRVSGTFKSGELTAIMGPSGAGKSSLLHILTGFQTSGVDGCIKCNGVQRSTSRANGLFRKESCYIMQEDYLPELFTIGETMMMTTCLKLGSSLSDKAKRLLVDEILDTMGLSKSINTRCSMLSGGQKKRLSIALELIDNPPVMFLDEPTTGLDSVSSLQCVSVMKALARGGRTIVCTVHQPCATLTDMFDHIYIISAGQCVYQGASFNMVPYLQKMGLQCPQYHNPADFMMEVVCGDHGAFQEHLVEYAKNDIWRKSGDQLQAIEPVKELGETERQTSKTMVLVHPPSEFYVFMILMNRCFLQLHRDWTVTYLKCLLHLLVGIILGLNFFDMGNNGNKTVSNLSFYLCSITYLSYTTMMPAIVRFPLEKEILIKEIFNNWYKLRTYYLAQTFAHLPLHILFSALNISVSYFLSGQPLDWQRFVMFFIVCCLHTVVADSSGILIGTFLRPTLGTLLGALITAYLILFSGFLMLFTHMPNYMFWMSYLSYFRYSNEALVLSVFSYGREKLVCPDDVTYCHLSDPKYILRVMGLQADWYWIDISVLLLFAFLLKMGAYYILNYKVGLFTACFFFNAKRPSQVKTKHSTLHEISEP